MSFGNLKKKTSIKKEADVIRTGNQPLPTGIQMYKIEMAYLDSADSGANALNLHLKHAGGLWKTKVWITGGDKKGNNNFYVDKDGNEQYLPGFIVADHIALLTTGEELVDLAEETETKAIKIYDFKQSKEVLTEVEVIEDMIGEEIELGVFHNIVDKSVKVTGSDGKDTYVPTGETRDENEIVKVFHPETGHTVTEMLDEVEEPTFKEEWLKAYDGKTFNKAKGAPDNGTKAGTPDAAATADTGTKKKGIFGKKKA